jgi:hypothetical protein
MREYTLTKRDNSIITPANTSKKSTILLESDINILTNMFKGLSRTYNLGKNTVFEQD